MRPTFFGNKVATKQTCCLVIFATVFGMFIHLWRSGAAGSSPSCDILPLQIVSSVGKCVRSCVSVAICPKPARIEVIKSAIHSSRMATLTVECFSESADQLVQPCVDCGLWTGNWCECFGQQWMPNSTWEPGQHTPLCTCCENRHGKCHYCRRVQWCTPFAWGPRSAPQ